MRNLDHPMALQYNVSLTSQLLWGCCGNLQTRHFLMLPLVRSPHCNQWPFQSDKLTIPLVVELPLVLIFHKITNLKKIFFDHQLYWKTRVGGGHGKETQYFSLVAQTIKNLPAMQETQIRSLHSEVSPGAGSGNPLQYSGLENSMDRGAWLAKVHGVAKNQTLLSD